ncbi:hypothetical protein F4779DRAFT_601848 [Xylariaceae sp. FL0662B]|nr:hypothetical protein F4779DRAFT_601848 [Xylariaceae sp. FL0662B]
MASIPESLPPGENREPNAIEKKQEEALLREHIREPKLFYLQFPDDNSSETGIIKFPYTHKNSATKCVLLNFEIIFNKVPKERLDLLWEERGPPMGVNQDKRIWRFINNEGMPIDYHFLENYFHRTFHTPDTAPLETQPMWWEHIIVRLQEVYDVMRKIVASEHGLGPSGASKFFGFFGQKNIYLRGFWILAEQKMTGENGYLRTCWQKNSNENAEGSTDNPRERETSVTEDAIRKKPRGFVAVDYLNILEKEEREQVYYVAECLRAWSDEVPVQPRLVRWAVKSGKTHGDPLTLLELTGTSNQMRW